MGAVFVKCEDCVFWKHHRSNQEEGTCHRHAPRFVIGMFPELVAREDAPDNAMTWGIFPETYCESGCGEGVAQEG